MEELRNSDQGVDAVIRASTSTYVIKRYSSSYKCYNGIQQVLPRESIGRTLQ